MFSRNECWRYLLIGLYRYYPLLLWYDSPCNTSALPASYSIILYYVASSYYVTSLYYITSSYYVMSDPSEGVLGAPPRRLSLRYYTHICQLSNIIFLFISNKTVIKLTLDILPEPINS